MTATSPSNDENEIELSVSLPIKRQACIMIAVLKHEEEVEMADISLDEARVKELLKQAVLEVLEERRDLICDLLAEVMEDFALARAIQEGESTESVTREEVLQTL